MKVIITVLLLLLIWAPAMGVQKGITLERVSSGFGIPRGLLLTMCEREGGPREDKKQILKPKKVHDGGKGSGACGMKLSTARLILRRPVSRKELQNIPFSAVLSARYLTEKRWCGRWQRWETRVLCYRVGPYHKVLPELELTTWKKLPRWWGTYKIFKRWKELWPPKKALKRLGRN